MTLTVVEIRGDKVRLGLDGDKSVTFHRAEIQQQIDAENRKEQRDERSPDTAA